MSMLLEVRKQRLHAHKCKRLIRRELEQVLMLADKLGVTISTAKQQYIKVNLKAENIVYHHEDAS